VFVQKTAPSQHSQTLAADSIKLKGVKYYVQRTNYSERTIRPPGGT
jgi:hypothetical protein